MIKIKMYFGLITLFFIVGCANDSSASQITSPINTSISTIAESSERDEPKSENENILYELDEKYNEEMDKTNGVTVDMVNVLLECSEQWKQEMINYYKLLDEKMDDNGKSKLLNSQKAWQSYIDLNNQLELLCNSFDGGGSSITELEADLEYRKYRDRTLKLADLYYGKVILKTSNEKAYGDISNDLDKKFIEEINNKKKNSTTERTRILLKYSMLWEDEMNQYYNSMLFKMNTEDKEKLTDCQKAWEVYCNQDNQLILYCNSMFNYNTDVVQKTAELEYQRFRERTLKLMDLNSLF